MKYDIEQRSQPTLSLLLWTFSGVYLWLTIDDGFGIWCYINYMDMGLWLAQDWMAMVTWESQRNNSTFLKLTLTTEVQTQKVTQFITQLKSVYKKHFCFDEKKNVFKNTAKMRKQ